MDFFSFFEIVDYFNGEDNSKKSKGKKSEEKSMLDDLGIGFLNIFAIAKNLDEIE